MNKEICRKCKVNHCIILLKKKKKQALTKNYEQYPGSFGIHELLGTDYILEKYGTAFRYRYNNGDSIEKGVRWHFDDYVPIDGCDCECYAEQMVSSLNNEELK